ncbi:MAG: phosphoribosyl-AMP cyclohydrolase [Phycisphaerae bacterium]
MQEISELKYDQNGLIPAIILDVETGEVLMMAYMNEQSLRATIETGKTHFWSRSRQKYWMKGEESGHTQEVKEIFIDCDKDTLLVKVKQTGAACHEGYRTCFFRRLTPTGQWETVGQKLFDPKEVYKKK